MTMQRRRALQRGLAGGLVLVLVLALVLVLTMRGGAPWLDTCFSAGFRGIDPRAEHLEVVDMSERFDSHAALLDQVDAARQALVRGAEAIAAEVARRLMA